MKINQIIQKALNQTVKSKEAKFSLSAMYDEVSLLKVVEKKNLDYVFYGEDNLAPQKLRELLNGSPIHNAIIKTKSLMIAGDGLLINGANTVEESEENYNKLSPKLKSEFDFLIKNPYSDCGYRDFINKVSFDFSVYGAICYEVVWNADFTKVAAYNHIPLEQIRSGKYEGGRVHEYYRSHDWCQRKPETTEYYCYNKSDKEHLSQLVYYKKGGLMYYGEPDYSGAIIWIQIDYNMGLFHLSNIENGMNPGLHVKVRSSPSDSEKQDIINEFKRAYKGAKNTGRGIFSFSSSAETQTEIDPIESSTLDKQLIHLSEQCDSKILSGHQLTTPLLAGISTPGKLGGEQELETGFKLYNNMVCEQARVAIINNLNKHIFNVNCPGIQLEINPYSPLREVSTVKKDVGIIDAINTLSPLLATKVLEEMTSEEIRGLIGLKGQGPTKTDA